MLQTRWWHPLMVLGLLVAFRATAQNTDIVHFSQLLPLLPDKVEGWEAQKPQGTTTTAMGLNVTEATREYTKGENQRVSIKIMQSPMTEAFLTAQQALANYSQESTDGYDKGFLLDGHPATEHFVNEDKDGTLTVLVDKRFLVEIHTEGLPSTAMQEWYKKLAVSKLQSLVPATKTK